MARNMLGRWSIVADAERAWRGVRARRLKREVRGATWRAPPLSVQRTGSGELPGNPWAAAPQDPF
jgi:hypothetical protein